MHLVKRLSRKLEDLKLDLAPLSGAMTFFCNPSTGKMGKTMGLLH